MRWALAERVVNVAVAIATRVLARASHDAGTRALDNRREIRIEAAEQLQHLA